MTRRKQREKLLELALDFAFSGGGADALEAAAVEAREFASTPYTARAIRGIIEHREELDQIIEPCLQNWKLARISRVTLSILRIAVYEMRYEDEIPVSVSINEAVELAKTYAGEDDWSFVNGVLSTVAKGGAS